MTRVKRLPVVDAGRLVGIVSRGDVLRIYLRADADIERDVERQVLRGVLALDPPEVSARVVDGVVTLTGTTDRRSTAGLALRLARAVDGVVRVVNDLRWNVDDIAEARLRYPLH
jgi:osmotically-inducible protein OsmY